MAYYEALRPSPLSYRERTEPPSELEGAIAKLVMNFQELETTITCAIASRLPTDDETAAVLTAELSFKQLVALLGSLIAHQSPNDGTPASRDRRAQLDELLGLCTFVEGERNRLVHSWWPATHGRGTLVIRRKRTAKRDGLREQSQPTSAGDVLDVADYCTYLATMVEEFFDLEFGVSDSL